MWCILNADGELKHAKAVQILVWVPISVALLLCGISLLRPSHWQTLAWGALVVIAGSAASQLLPKCRGRKLLKWVRAVCIGIVIAGGTFISTFGWSQRASYLRDRASLIAAAGEWRLSKAYIHVMRLRRDGFLRRGGDLDTPIFVFPTVHDTRQVLTQATTFRHDNDLIHALTVYVMGVDRLTAALESIHILCSQPVASMDMKKRAVEKELSENRGSAFDFFTAAHAQLGNALASRYHWAVAEATSRVDSEYLEAIESMSFYVSREADKRD